MPISLNFSKAEKGKVKEFLDVFEKVETKTHFEEVRVKIRGCAVTLYSSGKLTVQGKNEDEVKNFILKKLSFGEGMVLGIDEAGRGENFGSMVVAAVLGKADDLREVRDSKKVKDLEGKFNLVKKNAKGIFYETVSAKEIDSLREAGKNLNEIEIGAVEKLIAEAKATKKEFKILVDGGKIGDIPKAEFIVGGDDKNPVIGAASVVAKYQREKSKDKGKRKSWRS